MKIEFSFTAFKMAALLVVGLGTSTCQAAPAQVVWAKSYATALQEAKKTRKPLFLDFHTDWCSPCKELDKTTFTDPKFVAASRQWVMLKVNPEKSTAEFNLATKLKALKFPALLMLSPDGRRLGAAQGYYPAHVLVPKMKAALKKNRQAR